MAPLEFDAFPSPFFSFSSDSLVVPATVVAAAVVAAAVVGAAVVAAAVVAAAVVGVGVVVEFVSSSSSVASDVPMAKGTLP